MTGVEIATIAALGLAAGLVGGLAGIGGSIIILPGLHWVLHPSDPQRHHVFMAAAMTTNVFVALPSALSHHREGAVKRHLVRPVMFWTAGAVAVGVVLSNLAPGELLKVLLGVVVVLFAAKNLASIVRPRRRSFEGTGRVEHATPGRLATTGITTGLFSGLLGVGGGVVLVPMLHTLVNAKLRYAIAASSAVICVTAGVGAVLKLTLLSQLELSALDALKIAGVLIPTAMVGGWTGAKLTHKLPLFWVRVALIFILLAIAGKLFGLWGGAG
ncbi:MAG: anion permease [Phycisphaeraceae bacterium]|nr:MAG: anion permease [Phycisphaeraceae bacterium]